MHAIDNSPEAIARGLVEVYISMMKHSQGPLVELTAEFDLTLSQMKMLMILASSERPLAVNELAEATALSLPASGRAVDSLLRHKLVTRREDDCDRRIKRVALTTMGREATGRVADARLASVEAVLTQLSADERAAFAAALSPLIEKLA